MGAFLLRGEAVLASLRVLLLAGRGPSSHGGKLLTPATAHSYPRALGGGGTAAETSPPGCESHPCLHPSAEGSAPGSSAGWWGITPRAGAALLRLRQTPSWPAARAAEPGKAGLGGAHLSVQEQIRAGATAPAVTPLPAHPLLPPRPVEHSVRDPLLSPAAAAKLCELSWSILERGMLFIFILCIFCLGLLITFVPQERQLPQ